MKIAISPVSSGASITYDARTTSSSVGNGSTRSVVTISSPPLSQSWVGESLIIIGGTCDGFGEIISSTNYQYKNVTLSGAIPGVPSEGSSFHVFVSPSIVYDSAVSGGSIREAGSTTTVMQLQNLPDGVDTSTWSSGTFTINSGTQVGQGGSISSVANAGNLYVGLAAPMPTEPSAAEYVVVSRSSVTIGNRDTTLPEPYALSFTTSIESGYESCDARIYIPGELSAVVAERSLGGFLEVIDDYGRIVWEGIVLSVKADKAGVSIRAVGVADSFNHYIYSRQWLPDSVAGGTTPIDVLYDVLSASTLVRNDLYEVDGDGSIKANHQALGNYEFDYSETGASAREVIDDVLRFGDGSSSFNPVYLQIWNDRRPFLLVGKTQSGLASTSPKWVIDGAVSVDLDEEISIELDAGNIINKSSVVYTDLDTGAQNRTAFHHNIESVLDVGRREAIRSEGSIDSGNAIGVAGLVTSSFGRVTRFAPVKIYGKISLYGGGGLQDAHLVRAGDVVYMPIAMDVWSSVGSSVALQSKYVVSRTVYDAVTKQLTIEPHIFQDRIDVYMAGVL